MRFRRCKDYKNHFAHLLISESRVSVFWRNDASIALKWQKHMALARPEMAKAHSPGQSEAAPWVIVIPLCVPRPVRAKALYMVFSHGWSQQRHKGTHCVSTCLCAIYDLCKTRFTSRVGGLRLFIIVWLFILLCNRGYGGKVTICLRNDKGNGENF